MTEINYSKRDTSDWNVEEWTEQVSNELTHDLEERLEKVIKKIAAEIIESYFDSGDPLCAILTKEGVILEDAVGERSALIRWKDEAWIDFSDEQFLRFIIQRMMEDCITHHEDELESFKRIVHEEISNKEGSKPAKLKPKE